MLLRRLRTTNLLFLQFQLRKKYSIPGELLRKQFHSFTKNMKKKKKIESNSFENQGKNPIAKIKISNVFCLITRDRKPINIIIIIILIF